MRVEIVSIGDELLRGDTLNTNLAYLGGRLADLGIPPSRETCVCDEPEAIRQAVEAALPKGGLVITIGGLGPTCDDVTRGAVAEVLGVPLVEDPGVAASIRAFLTRRGVIIPEDAVRIQSEIPEGAAVLSNANGTAPGLWCDAPRGGAVAMLPGPPREFQPLVEDQLLPRIAQRLPSGLICPRIIRVSGLPESVVERRINRALRGYEGMVVAYCAKPTGVTVRIGTTGRDDGLLSEAEARVRSALGRAVIPAHLPGVVEHIGHLLGSRGWLLALAESCTGGMIAAAVTEVAGCSAWFAGSAVTYSDSWKHSLLGVSEETLREHGAVSAETVGEMVAGVRDRFGADAAVAVSGIAGPGGAVAGKPVGTVFIGVSVKERGAVSRFLFPGNRDTVRVRTVGTAFTMLRDMLMEDAPPGTGR